MSTVDCECGRSYTVAADKAGKKFRCKDCDERLVVPDEEEGDWEPRKRRRSASDDETYTERFGEGNRRVVVAACPEAVRFVKPSELEGFGESLLSFLEADRRSFRKVSLKLDIDRCHLDDDLILKVRAKLIGTINGKSIEQRFTKTRNVGEIRTAERSAAMITGGVVGAVVHDAIQTEGPNTQERRWVRNQIRDFLTDAITAIEKKSGRAPAKSSGQMAVYIATGVAFPIAALLLFLVAKSTSPPGTETGILGIVAVGGGLMASLVAFAIGMLCMPASYFEREAAGRRMMRLLGVSSVNGIRIFSIVAIVVAVAVIGYLFYMPSTFKP